MITCNCGICKRNDEGICSEKVKQRKIKQSDNTIIQIPAFTCDFFIRDKNKEV